MSDLRTRLIRQLEPVLLAPDPRPQISAYHDMPYALFRYDPEDELELRKELALLDHPARTGRASVSLASRWPSAWKRR